MAERGGEGKRVRGTVCFYINSRGSGQIMLKDSNTVIDVSYEDIIVNPGDPKCLVCGEDVEFQIGVKKGITYALHVTGPNRTPIPKKRIDRFGTVRLAKGSGGGGGGTGGGGGGGGTSGGGSSSGTGGGGSHGDGGGVV